MSTCRAIFRGLEGTAYFVACESLTNAAKHAGTDDARVRLSHPGSRLCLVVEDDGRGFELNGARSGGLANIRDRVEALHGQLTIESRLGAGTSVRAELPKIGVVVLSQHTGMRVTPAPCLMTTCRFGVPAQRSGR